MQLQQLNELAAQVHNANAKWWHDLETGKPIKRNPGQLLMLVITELAEAVEGIRKNLMDDKLTHRRMEEVEMADAFIRLLDFAGGFKLQLNDYKVCSELLQSMHEDKSEAILSICECVLHVYKVGVDQKDCGKAVSIALLSIQIYCQKFGMDLPGAYADKQAYNATRHDHTVEARKAANGKKF